MRIALHSVNIVNPAYKENETKNVLIENGIITAITKDEIKGDINLKGQNLKLSIGWFDLCATVGEPGFEHKETILSIQKSAAAGGFTEIAILPNTEPILQSKDAILNFISGNKSRLVQLLPIAAASINTKGEEMTEILDLKNAGALAFTDGDKPLTNASLLIKVLNYISHFDGLFINRPENTLINANGVMNEGLNSTKLGLKGMPKMAEEMVIERDLRILEYGGGRMHFSNISTSGAVDMIRKAKKQGLPVSCDVAAHNLVFDDSVMSDFDTNFKVNPPFREDVDRVALWKGLSDNTIDAVVSAHKPQDEECKKLEFDLAEFGVIGLETVFPVLNTFNESLELAAIIEKLTMNPRNILRQAIPEIKVGSPANLTLFEQETEWIYTEKMIQSKSKNSPFIGQKFKGRAVAVINNNQCTFDKEYFS